MVTTCMFWTKFYIFKENGSWNQRDFWFYHTPLLFIFWDPDYQAPLVLRHPPYSVYFSIYLTPVLLCTPSITHQRVHFQMAAYINKYNKLTVAYVLTSDNTCCQSCCKSFIAKSLLQIPFKLVRLCHNMYYNPCTQHHLKQLSKDHQNILPLQLLYVKHYENYYCKYPINMKCMNWTNIGQPSR